MQSLPYLSFRWHRWKTKKRQSHKTETACENIGPWAPWKRTSIIQQFLESRISKPSRLHCREFLEFQEGNLSLHCSHQKKKSFWSFTITGWHALFCTAHTSSATRQEAGLLIKRSAICESLLRSLRGNGWAICSKSPRSQRKLHLHATTTRKLNKNDSNFVTLKEV